MTTRMQINTRNFKYVAPLYEKILLERCKWVVVKKCFSFFLACSYLFLLLNNTWEFDFVFPGAKVLSAVVAIIFLMLLAHTIYNHKTKGRRVAHPEQVRSIASPHNFGTRATHRSFASAKLIHWTRACPYWEANVSRKCGSQLRNKLHKIKGCGNDRPWSALVVHLCLRVDFDLSETDRVQYCMYQ